MKTEFEEVVFANTPEEFLKNLEQLILLGYRVKEVPYDFGMGVWSCRMSRYYGVAEASKMKKEDVEFRLDPPYTVSELRVATWGSILKLCDSLYISSHGNRNIVIDRIIIAQKERNAGVQPDMKKVRARMKNRERKRRAKNEKN